MRIARKHFLKTHRFLDAYGLFFKGGNWESACGHGPSGRIRISTVSNDFHDMDMEAYCNSNCNCIAVVHHSKNGHVVLAALQRLLQQPGPLKRSPTSDSGKVLGSSRRPKIMRCSSDICRRALLFRPSVRHALNHVPP
jgi:hypothetical protein